MVVVFFALLSVTQDSGELDRILRAQEFREKALRSFLVKANVVRSGREDFFAFTHGKPSKLWHLRHVMEFAHGPGGNLRVDAVGEELWSHDGKTEIIKSILRSAFSDRLIRLTGIEEFNRARIERSAAQLGAPFDMRTGVLGIGREPLRDFLKGAVQSVESISLAQGELAGCIQVAMNPPLTVPEDADGLRFRFFFDPGKTYILRQAVREYWDPGRKKGELAYLLKLDDYRQDANTQLWLPYRIRCVEYTRKHGPEEPLSQWVVDVREWVTNPTFPPDFFKPRPPDGVMVDDKTTGALYYQRTVKESAIDDGVKKLRELAVEFSRLEPVPETETGGRFNLVSAVVLAVIVFAFAVGAYWWRRQRRLAAGNIEEPDLTRDVRQ